MISPDYRSLSSVENGGVAVDILNEGGEAGSSEDHSLLEERESSLLVLFGGDDVLDEVGIDEVRGQLERLFGPLLEVAGVKRGIFNRVGLDTRLSICRVRSPVRSA